MPSVPGPLCSASTSQPTDLVQPRAHRPARPPTVDGLWRSNSPPASALASLFREALGGSSSELGSGPWELPSDCLVFAVASAQGPNTGANPRLRARILQLWSDSI
jgi:hypothetical protein